MTHGSQSTHAAPSGRPNRKLPKTRGREARNFAWPNEKPSDFAAATSMNQNAITRPGGSPQGGGK